MWPSADSLALTAPQRNALRRLVRGRNTTQKMVLRAHIVLRCAQGLANHAMARELGVNRKTVILWRKRFAQSGLDGLRDRTRPGRKPALSAEFVQCILDTTLHEKPRAATHWSTRTLAKHLGVSKMAIQRVWKAHGLQPHRLETFKLSRDKQFVEKLRDVVGLYLNPPEHALVLSVDEKSQIQALDRSQPGLPLKKGRAGTMTHDFKRHGTTTLFAAFNVLDGQVIGECLPRHRHQEFLKSGYPLYSSDARRHVWSRTRMDAGGHSTGESRRFYRFRPEICDQTWPPGRARSRSAAPEASIHLGQCLDPVN